MDPNYINRPVQLIDAIALQHCAWPNYSLSAVEALLKRVMARVAEGRAVGLVVANHLTNEAFAYGQITRWPRVAEISDLAVAIDQRGKGIGSALIKELIRSTGHWQKTQIEIGVALSNTRALALYHRLGFVDTRIVMLDLGYGLESVLYLTLARDTSPESQSKTD